MPCARRILRTGPRASRERRNASEGAAIGPLNSVEEKGSGTVPPIRDARIRVAVILGVLFPEELAVWRGCNQTGAHITLIGTTSNLFRKWPWKPGQPKDLDSVVLRSLTPPVSPRMQLWLVYMGLLRTLRRIRPDVIHVYTEPWGGRVLQILFGPGAGRLGAPVSIHAAETLYDQGPRLERMARSAILAKVFPRIAGFASWSEQGIEEARRAGLKDVPTEIVPGIVPDPELLAPIRGLDREKIRSELGLPPGIPIVGYVGRLVEEKGIRDLLAALERLEETGQRPYLAVWGAGPLEELVKKWLSSDARRGAYGGPLPIGDVPRAFRACDAMVLPSRRTATWQEQFGRVLLEAMLVDCPIIAYRSGAIPEAVGQGALLVDEGDVPGLSAAIHGLMSDQGARDALAARARAQADRYHPRVLGEKMNRFWSEVIRRSSGRSA